MVFHTVGEPLAAIASASDCDDFTQGYIEAALWSSTDDAGDPLDGGTYTTADLSPHALSKMWADCQRFQRDNRELWEADDKRDSYAGHNFWLTRNGHGAGFWDGDYPTNGEALTTAAKAFGECSLYVGDDGKIHHYGS